MIDFIIGAAACVIVAALLFKFFKNIFSKKSPSCSKSCMGCSGCPLKEPKEKD